MKPVEVKYILAPTNICIIGPSAPKKYKLQKVKGSYYRAIPINYKNNE